MDALDRGVQASAPLGNLTQLDPPLKQADRDQQDADDDHGGEVVQVVIDEIRRHRPRILHRLGAPRD
jgi:hypothetical protein